MKKQVRVMLGSYFLAIFSVYPGILFFLSNLPDDPFQLPFLAIFSGYYFWRSFLAHLAGVPFWLS